MPQFIETQFPIARLSAEAYKERKAGASQTLTGLGKWWGRKPLILVRAAILGMLMPASTDPRRDREIFLKILTIDDDGAFQRWKRSDRFTETELRSLATNAECEQWDRFSVERKALKEKVQKLRLESKSIERGNAAAKVAAREAVSQAVAAAEAGDAAFTDFLQTLQTRVFYRLPYAKRITRCERPENVVGPSVSAWADINSHLGTAASDLTELVDQLGQRMFGHRPRVGDSFCGGGSIPFEAARIGCSGYGADLNPTAGLLTWASLNLVGGGPQINAEVREMLTDVFSSADDQIRNWQIEHNDKGERAEAYVYCVESKPDGCEYYIPLAPTWIVDENLQTVALWTRSPRANFLTPTIRQADLDEISALKTHGATVVNGRIVDPFDANRTWSLEALRGPQGLRRWTNEDLVPRPDDVFQERLYCIRWVNDDGERRYAAPDAADLARESRVLQLLRERFDEWQQAGFIPSRAIPERGDETDRLFRERGWTHWHHLFTPRELLVHGLLAELASRYTSRPLLVASMLNMGRLADWDSRLSCWLSHKSQMSRGKNTFLNQALNTLFNYPTRPLLSLREAQISISSFPNAFKNSTVQVGDAREINEICDLWITDPPYADAVNYHELADFFLAWYDKQLARTFPEWIPDSRAELAVRGDGDDFRRSMVEIYRNLASHMPDNGMQMVMFTHQNPAVWADLGMILWAAGLRATAAWTISTETDAVGIKKGNYVQGTVCLVLRKRLSAEPGFLDEIYPMVEDEVRRQIDSMQELDAGSEPNFNDADYQLAAYAAALKVLTQYSQIDGRDVEHEVFAVRDRNQTSQFQQVIERALQIACDYLIPRGLDSVWRELSLDERYYLRALDIESRGERRQGMYEELARGFGVTDIRPLLKSDKANGARVHTATGFARTLLTAPAGTSEATSQLSGLPRGTARGRGRATAGEHAFGRSPLRHLLFAIRETTAAERDPEPGRQYLRDTFGSTYWATREKFIALLDWLAQLSGTADMSEWTRDSDSARILAGRLRNDQG